MIKLYLNNFILNDGIQISRIDKVCRIKVEGHSGWGQKGSDIVCSAVSAIIQTAVVAITEVAKIHQEVVQRDGYLESTISTDDAESAGLNALKIILDTMLVGLNGIMDNYPETVEVIFE